MKKILQIIVYLFLFEKILAVPVEIMDNQPDKQAYVEGMLSLQGVINGISTAQNTEQQIKALQNLQNLQNNPSATIIEVNNAVNGLISNFNSLNSSHIQNLSSLITSLATSTNGEAMNIKLIQASNMQLSAIQSTLQGIQAQNQAIIAYKQAEVNDHKRADQKMSDMNKATSKAFNGL